MALKYYTGDKITGLSTDTKPTTIGDGATFYETDTKKIYIKVSGSWVEVNYQSALGFTPENVANKRTSFQSTPDDTHYPSEKLVKDSLDTKMINPMTASGDIIYGGNNGAPTRLAKGTDGQVLTLSSGVPAWVSGGEGSGDVSGPEGATADNIAVFDGTTGKLIKDSGHKLSDYQTALGFTPENSANKKTSLTDNSDTYYPSQKAVKTAVDAKADNPHDNSQHNDLAFEALRFDAQTAPATPSSDSQYVYLTASGTSPNRLLELKIKNQNGIEVVLSSIIV
jgi:hypothetical protein